jgi:hypothetical protein
LLPAEAVTNGQAAAEHQLFLFCEAAKQMLLKPVGTPQRAHLNPMCPAETAVNRRAAAEHQQYLFMQQTHTFL